MNITFMIGNGFDLNQKLKTGYKDFYEYYIKNTKENIISKSIKNNYELWADLELGLGRLLKDVKESQIEEFLDSKENLENLLAIYLAEESARFAITDDTKFVDEFKNKIINFSNGFCAEDKNHLKKVISNTKEAINYRFITFNYTDVLDKMIETVKKKSERFNTHVSGVTRYTDELCNPHHIHGTLNGEDLILCVDNVSQIDNEVFQNDRRITDYMIKANVNKALGERKIETARDIIDKSTYICLYGLSIGDTDHTWWKYLVEWLKKSSEHRLVLFYREDSKVQQSGAGKIRTRDKHRATFAEKSSCGNTEQYDKFRDKIITVRNSNIFTYKNIIVDDKNKE